MGKFVYIKKSQGGKFLEFPEKFNEELFDNVGKSWEDYEAGKWVQLNAKQVKFHEEHPEASEKEVWDMKLAVKVAANDDVDPGEQDILETPLQRKLREIDEYSDVYAFSLNGKDMWLDAQQRQEILDDAKAFRFEKVMEMTHWLDGTEYALSIQKWIALVNRIRIYDSKVRNVKEAHKAAVRALKSDEEIENYDYTTGYPEKVTIEL